LQLAKVARLLSAALKNQSDMRQRRSQILRNPLSHCSYTADESLNSIEHPVEECRKLIERIICADDWHPSAQLAHLDPLRQLMYQFHAPPQLRTHEYRSCKAEPQDRKQSRRQSSSETTSNLLQLLDAPRFDRSLSRLR
jgi:hypothetical protein